ncbi:MFS transporter [Micromonospora sp. NBC_01655]|uniref:MFS transporter n=1 Tax=unclassified Micromonospora TaxID=2617518 RepID=UPI001404F349|nr:MULTISPECIES: MFS transporter [unclassified Micromonospora]MCX4472193.1 MFS transporter [Micromonospora sp. NBC_01655]
MVPPGYQAPARPPVVRPLWVFASPAFGALLAAGLLTAPIGPLASAIQRDLGLSTVAMTATLFAPYVVAMAALVAPGYLLGGRWPTATGVPALVLLIVGSVVSAFVPGAALMAVGRVVVGLGAGTLVGIALALSGQLGRWRSQARLVLGLALGAALLLGPVASGLLTQALGWRWAFLVNVPMAAAALAVAVASGIAMSVLGASRPSPPAAPATTTPLPSEAPFGGPVR